MTSSRSISDAANSRSSAWSLSRDGLMDARLSVVVIAINPFANLFTAPIFLFSIAARDSNSKTPADFSFRR
jgi:hypothetical protein